MGVKSRSADHARPILVTGSHHSGTTWVGKMLSSAPGLGYVNEPFNRFTPPWVPGNAISVWFPYLTKGHVDAVTRSAIASRLRFEYPLRTEVLRVQSVKDGVRLVRDLGQFARSRWTHARPVIKDPIALLSSEWLAEEFGVMPLLLVRHPAAFAGTMVARRESHDFGDFLKQERLMDEHLSPFADRINDFARRHHDTLEQAALLWSILNSFILTMLAKHPDWLMVRHEDLCVAPVEQFRAIFGHFDVEFGPSVVQTIREYSAGGHSATGKHPGDQHRDSSAVRWSWTARLTAPQVLALRAAVSEWSDPFYGPGDWTPPGG